MLSFHSEKSHIQTLFIAAPVSFAHTYVISFSSKTYCPLIQYWIVVDGDCVTMERYR